VALADALFFHNILSECRIKPQTLACSFFWMSRMTVTSLWVK
jgi:hypothetical protein